MTDSIEKVYPFDSFAEVYKILGWIGLYRALNNPASRFKRILHQIYKALAFLIVFVYNVQHIIFILQNCRDINKMIDSLTITIPQFNLITKIATVYYQTARMDRLNEFLKEDPTFRADDEEGQAILRKNKQQMHRLYRFLMTCVTLSAILWIPSFFVRRFTDPTETVPSYVPFEVNSWASFSLSVFVECSPLPWTGFGHIILDLTVATYYAHAHTQLKIIQQQLLLVNVDTGLSLQYKDEVDEGVNRRFVQVVKRYDKLMWFKNEIDSIFNFSLSFQFVSMSLGVCILVYRMTVVSLTSFPFLFLITLFCMLMTQILLCCFFGNLVEFESRLVNDYLYNCDWLSLSPSFRRQMLIAMVCWAKPLQPRIGSIIPLSLETFLTIVKSSYTLYTVLTATVHNKD